MNDIKETLEALSQWAKENLGKVSPEVEERMFMEIFNLRHQLAGLEAMGGY